MPGDRKNFEIYWYTDSVGNFTANLRAYFADEVLEKNFSIKKNVSTIAKSVFEIKDFRTYSRFIIFDVVANRSVKDVVVIPSNFPPGWIFSQEKISSIKKDCRKTVIIHYESSVWTPENVKLEIASDEGKFYTEKVFELKKESGIRFLAYYIVDNLKLLFQKCF